MERQSLSMSFVTQARGLGNTWMPLPPLPSALQHDASPPTSACVPTPVPGKPAPTAAAATPVATACSITGTQLTSRQPCEQPHSPASASPAHQPRMDAAAAERLSGSPLLGSLLEALRPSQQRQGAAVPAPADSSTRDGGSPDCFTPIASAGGIATPGTSPPGALPELAIASLLQPQPPGAGQLAESSASLIADVEAIVLAAKVAAPPGSRSGRRRLSPQTPEVQPTQSQGSSRRTQ